MGKKYKGKACAYCGKTTASSSADHVFARQLFLVRHRANLPIVPACDKCNSEKSRSEAYVALAFPNGGRHKFAIENIETFLPRRFAKNVRAEQELRSSRSFVPAMTDKGLIVPAGAYKIDAARVKEWVSFVARGLSFYHWEVAVKKSEYTMIAGPPNKLGRNLLSKCLDAGADQLTVTSRTLGEGTMSYWGGRSLDHIVWFVSPYGGVQTGGSDTDEVSNCFMFMARSNAAIERERRAAQWKGSLILRP